MIAKTAPQERLSGFQALEGAKNASLIPFQTKMALQRATNALRIQKQTEQELRLLMNAHATREGFFKATHAFNAM